MWSQLSGSTLSVTTIATGGFYNSTSLTCPAGYRRLSCYTRAGDSKTADRYFGEVPVGTNSCTFYNGWGTFKDAYGYMDCFK